MNQFTNMIKLLIFTSLIIVSFTQLSAQESNDFEGANSSAKNAKLLALIAIGIAVVYLIYVGMNWDDTMEKFNEAMEQYQMNQ